MCGTNNYSGDMIFSTQLSGTINPLVERMRITCGGNVGIGTTSPVANLDLGASGANNIILRNTGNAYNLGYIGNASGRIDIGFSNSNSSLSPLPYLSVTSGGNVGIGIDAPAYTLDVNKCVAANFVARIANSSPTGYGLYIQANDNTKAGIRIANASGGTAIDLFGSGAATFTCSVTAGDQIRITGTTANALYLYGAATVKPYITINEFGVRDWKIGAGTSCSGKLSITATLAGTDGITIDGSGNVGIGNINPQTRLDLGAAYGNCGQTLFVYNDDNSGPLAGTKVGFYIDRFSESNSVTFVFPQAGGTTSRYHIAYKGTSGTTITDLAYLNHNSTSWVFPSDERMKNIEGIIPNALDKIKDLRAVYYSQKRDPEQKRKVGLLAQDLLKVLPEIVDVPDTEFDNEGNQRYMSVALSDTIPLLVKAIQEQQCTINTLKTCLGIA
jgi:hypothetical protein